MFHLKKVFMLSTEVNYSKLQFLWMDEIGVKHFWYGLNLLTLGHVKEEEAVQMEEKQKRPA